MLLQPPPQLYPPQVRTVTSVPSTSTIPEVIDPNKCCMCFVTYEDDVLDVAGAEWIFCKCGRDCTRGVEDVVKDSTGDERYCFFCNDKYTVIILAVSMY